MLGLFKKREKEAEERRETGLDPVALADNCVECENCGSRIPIEPLQPLTIEKCPACSNPIFIPMKIKNFWLFKPLGGGGMGSVYKAFLESNASLLFAVKVLARTAKRDQHLIHALLNEAAIGKSFGRHPHLISVFDYGQYNDEFYCAMEFVEGKRLDQIIEEKSGVQQKYAMLWGLQLLSAEQRIYESGYLFRDLKPQNVIIDTKGNAKLFDYGLCLSIDAAFKPTPSDTVEGSPIYMPPERIVGLPESMNSEIYSLGMLLFHLLSGKPYYSSTDAYNLAKKHVASLRVASVAGIMPKTVDKKITLLIDRMVARNPEERFQTYMEAASEMNAIFKEL